MSYQLKLVQKPAYLHAIVTGQNSRENVEKYLRELRDERIARGCSKVLVEERLAGPRVSIADAFQIAAGCAELAYGANTEFAYVDVYAVNDSMKFAESVAVNRGVSVAIFSNVHDAEKWLLRDEHAAVEGGKFLA